MNDITAQLKHGIPDDEFIQTRLKPHQGTHASGLETTQKTK
jgi:hypothetical protein